jgi:hypothetical protein
MAPLALLLWLAACGGERPPDADWPGGALLSGRRDAVARHLSDLSRIEGTPLARESQRWLATLPDCPEIEARAPTLAGLPDAWTCAAPDTPPSGIRRHRGEADLALALPIGADPAAPRVLVTSRTQGERTRLEVHWPRWEGQPPIAVLLPGSAPAGAPRLAPAERVLHALVRSDGLDLTALVPQGSQADDLFRLRSRLLSSALLDGSWELAVYPPAPGQEMPRIAVALGVRAGAAARAAAERVLDDVESAGPLRRQRVEIAGREADCLPELRLLPELAPCLVARDDALVVGWNAASLRYALASSPHDAHDARDESGEVAAGRIEIDFDRLYGRYPHADRSLAAQRR